MRIFKTEDFSGSRILIGWSGFSKSGLQWNKGIIDRPGVLFSLRGSGLICYGGKNQMIRPGDMVYYNALPRHSFRIIEEWSYYYFHFPESMIEIWEKIPCNTEVSGVRIVHFEKNDFARITLELKEARSYFMLRPDGWETITEALLQVVLARFFHLLPSAGEPETERLQPAIQHLSASGSSANMTKLAKICGMSRTDFFRKFRSAYGCTPGKYRINLLLSQAKILLCTTDFQIKEIAAQLQFNDCYYFSKFFRSCTGFTPSEWRKENAGIKDND